MTRRHVRGPVVAILATLVVAPAGARAATVTVTSPGDDVAVDGSVSLREAIATIDDASPVNADVVPSGVLGSDDRIAFDLPGGAPAVITIGDDVYLPHLTRPVTIDGTTQPGAAGTPTIGVHITSPGGGREWLVAAARVVVRGLDTTTVQLDPGSSGSIVQGNRLEALLASGDHALLGGTDPGSGNVVRHLFIDGTDNVAVGNLESTGPGGTSAGGVSLRGTGNRVGGTTAAERNILSTVEVSGVGDVLEGNYVGVDPSGAGAFNPYGGGVTMVYGHDNVVGGDAPGAGNVISGNATPGVVVGELATASSHNAVIGNRIGTTATGDAKLPNAGAGIVVHSADGTRIVGNLIAGNAGPGIWLAGGNSTHTVIQDDTIGTAADRTTLLGNDGDGILFDFAGSADVVSTDLAAPTVIAGNGGIAIHNRGGLIHLGRVRAFGNAQGTLVQQPAPTYTAAASMAPDGRTATVKVTGATPGGRLSVWAAFDPTCDGALQPYAEGVASGTVDVNGAITLTVPVTPALTDPTWLRLFVDDASIGTIVPAPTCLRTPPGTLSFDPAVRLQSLRVRQGALAFSVAERIVNPGANAAPGAPLRVDAASKGVRVSPASVAVPSLAGFGSTLVHLTGAAPARPAAGATTASWHWREQLAGRSRRVVVTAFFPAARVGTVRAGVLHGRVTREPRAVRAEAAPGAADPNAVIAVEVSLNGGGWRAARLDRRHATWSLRLPAGARGGMSVAVRARTRAGATGRAARGAIGRRG
jgi:hypothetical protein